EVQQGSLDFGALTFHPPEAGLLEVTVGSDELVLLVPPAHRLAKRHQVTMEDVAQEPIVAHNDPSPARERVLRLFEERHITLNMVLALPSLDGIKRAVELQVGVALLPRRCAITEIAAGRPVAVPVPGLSRRRQPALVCRRAQRTGGDHPGIDARRDPEVWRVLDERLQPIDRLAFRREARNAEHRRVALKNLRERFADDAADPESREALRRVLARRPASEIAVHDEERRPRESRVAERMIRPRRAIVFEQMPLEAFEGNGAEETRGHDPIRVDVVAAQRQPGTGDDENRPALLTGPGAGLFCHTGTSSSIERKS